MNRDLHGSAPDTCPVALLLIDVINDLEFREADRIQEAALACVLFTANDAYIRNYELVVPADCTASNEREDNAIALDQMRRLLKGGTRPSNGIDLADIARGRSRIHS